MKKRIISLLLLFVFLALIVQGCTNKGRDASKENNDITGGNGKHASGDAAGKVSAKDSEQAMGRYIENKAKLPEMSQGEIILGILMNPDGYFEVYTMHKGRYYCYRQNKDDLWESNMPGWLNNDTVKKADVITNIQQGGDGNYYACLESYTNKESRCRIVQSADGGNTVQTVDMPYLNKAESETAEYTLYPRIQQMGVMENGTYVFNDVGDPDILMLYSPEGDKLDELEIDYRQNFLVTGNKLIAAGKDETGILFYDGDSMTVEKTIAYTLDNRALTFALKEDNTLLVVDSDGIHRMSGDGTLWEIVVDGILNSMSMPSLTPYSLYVTEGEHEEYHVVYKDANEGTYSLMHYRFDKNVSSVPSREITVYSLRENKTIRQAIAMFQAQNDDIKINYVVAMENAAGNVSDYIRALNTELLAGNGADILVLDGLPVDSYMEKAVLEDISDIICPLEDAGMLLPNISEGYHTDNKIYMMPVRFTVPVILGKADAVKNVSSLDSIVNYMARTDIPYSGSASYRELLLNYLALYSDDFLQNRAIDRDKLTGFLRNIKEIADNTQASEHDEEKNRRSESGSLFGNEDLFTENAITLYDENVSSGLIKIANINDLIIPFAVIKNEGLSYDTLDGQFLPIGIIGLNSTGKDKETAKAFISYLFTGDVQDANLYDGFPVNSSSIDKWFAQDNEDFYVAFSSQNGKMISGGWPSRGERKAFRDKISNIRIPIETDNVLNQMIIEGALPYLLGNTDIDRAVAGIMEKAALYLTE